MKLTDEIKAEIIEGLHEKYDHERIEFLDDEFVLVYTTDKDHGNIGIYPLLGHVCGTDNYTSIYQLKFLGYKGDAHCECDPTIYPKKFKALYALRHLDI